MDKNKIKQDVDNWPIIAAMRSRNKVNFPKRLFFGLRHDHAMKVPVIGIKVRLKNDEFDGRDLSSMKRGKK